MIETDKERKSARERERERGGYKGKEIEIKDIIERRSKRVREIVL